MDSIFRKMRNIADAAKEAENTLRRAASRAKEEFQHQFEKIQKNIVEMDKDEPSFYDPEECDAEGLLITIPADKDEKPAAVNMPPHDLCEKLSDAIEPRQQVKITFKSTVPECGRAALLRFRATSEGHTGDVHAYAAKLRKAMPDNERRVKREIDDLMDALENLRICNGDQTVLNYIASNILGNETAFEFDMETWTWTACTTGGRWSPTSRAENEAHLDRTIPQLFDALLTGDNEDEHAFTPSDLRGMALKCKVSIMPRRSKPRTACSDLKWLDECVEKLVAEDLDA